MVEIRIAMVPTKMVVMMIVMIIIVTIKTLMVTMTLMMMNLATIIKLQKIVWERKEGGARCRRQELCLSCLSRQRQ